MRAKQVTVQITPELAARLDAVRASGAVPPSESAVLRAAVCAGLPVLERAAGITEPHTTSAEEAA